jgi:hypothetical protein
MVEIHGPLGPLFACHVIQRQGLQPHPGMLTPTPARLQLPRRLLTADTRPIADPVPAGPADIPLHDPTAGSVRSR